MSAASMAKDQQMVEAALRDKDPEWFQTQDTGHSSTGGGMQGGNTIVHSRGRRSNSARATPQGEVTIIADW